MKKRTIRRLKRITATVLMTTLMTAMMFSSRYSATTVQAAANTLYISEVKLAYGGSAGEAKNILTNAGYQVYDKDLNEGTSEKCVFLGYKTTADPTEAITDIKAVEQDNGYQIYDTETLMQGMKDNALTDAQSIMKAVLAFRESYNSGAVRAVDAYNTLQKFRYSESLMLGDYIMYEATAMNLTDVILYSDASTYQALVELLGIGIYNDTSTTWLTRLSGDVPTYEVDAVLKSKARKILKSIQSLLVHMKDEEDSEEMGYDIAAALITLASYKYKGAPVIEYFLQENLTAEMLYDVAAIMSDVDIALLTELGLSGLCTVSDNIDVDSNPDSSKNGEEDLSTEEYDFWAGSAKTDYSTIAITNDTVRAMVTGDEQTIINGLSNTVAINAIVSGSTAALATISTAYLWSRYAFANSAVETVKYIENFFAEYVELKDVQHLEMYEKFYYNAKDIENIAHKGNWGKLDNPYLKEQIYNKMPESAKQFLGKGKLSKSFRGGSGMADIRNAARFRAATKIGAIASSVMMVAMVVLAGFMIKNAIQEYYNPTYSPRPQRIMSLEVTADEDEGYVLYDAVLDGDTLLDVGDTNAYKGLKWNALYTTKDDLMGTPIKADTFVGTSGAGLTAITYFGQVAPTDMNKNARNHNSTINIFFERANENTMASIFSTAHIWMLLAILGIGLVAGGTILFVSSRKKQK